MPERSGGQAGDDGQRGRPTGPAAGARGESGAGEDDVAGRVGQRARRAQDGSGRGQRVDRTARAAGRRCGRGGGRRPRPGGRRPPRTERRRQPATASAVGRSSMASPTASGPPGPCGNEPQNRPWWVTPSNVWGTAQYQSGIVTPPRIPSHRPAATASRSRSGGYRRDQVPERRGHGWIGPEPAHGGEQARPRRREVVARRWLGRVIVAGRVGGRLDHHDAGDHRGALALEVGGPPHEGGRREQQREADTDDDEDTGHGDDRDDHREQDRADHDRPDQVGDRPPGSRRSGRRPSAHPTSRNRRSTLASRWSMASRPAWTCCWLATACSASCR